MLSFLSLAVSSRSLVETNKYLLFSFLTLRNDKTQVAEAEMAAEVAAEDGAVRAAAALDVRASEPTPRSRQSCSHKLYPLTHHRTVRSDKQ